VRWRRKRSGEGGEEASKEGVGPGEARPNGSDPETGFWPGTEHLRNRPRVEHLAKIGHAEPFATLEEGVAFWESHGYALLDRSATRAELKSPAKVEVGCGFRTLTTAGILVGVFVWPILILTFVLGPLAIIFAAVTQMRERVVLEATPEGVVESRSLSMFKLFR